MRGRGAVCVLVAVMLGLALVRSAQESEGVAGVTDGGTLDDSDDDPPPWVMEDTPQNGLEELQLWDDWETRRVDSETAGNGRLPPSAGAFDSDTLQKEVNIDSNTEEAPVVDDHKLSDGGGSTARPPEHEASPQAEELKSLSDSVTKESSQVSGSTVVEGELGEDQGHKEREDVESPEQVETEEVSIDGSPEEKSANDSDTQGMEERKPPLQEEHRPQEGEEEDDGKEGEKEEEEGDLTFEEFKRRKMMEQEAAQQVADSIASIPISKTKNNYASVDCGAKVIGTNHEARNPTAILIENRDVYMLNPCSADIWFVVELCDMVSVQTLEIACLELFSSVPESFNVYSAERYPDPEWVHLGQFQAANEREVQSFPLATDQHVYAKYIKVEMVSHYGREHYCPISLLRVLGASMIEVFQDSEERKELQSQQQPAGSIAPSMVLPPSEGFSEDDSLGEAENERVRPNGALLSAAKDAVLTLLEQPLNLLGVNGFMKLGEGERAGHGSCKEGMEGGCLVKEAAVAGDEQKGVTPERTPEGDKILETSDQDLPDQDPGEEREESVSEQDRAPSERTPEVQVAANGSKGGGEGGERSPPRPEETLIADPDTAPADTVDPSGADFNLGPSDPHSFRTEQELKETSIDSENTSNESSTQNSIDVVERSPLNGTTTLQPQGEGNGKNSGPDVPPWPEEADRGNCGGQFQDGGELESTTADDSDQISRDDHASAWEPLESGPDVLVEGEELGAGDGEWGLALDAVESEDARSDEAGGKIALKDGAKSNGVDDTPVSHSNSEATMGLKDGSPLQAMGPEVDSLRDKSRGNGEGQVGVPQGEFHGTGIELGPTMAPGEDVALHNGGHASVGNQEVDSVGNQEVDSVGNQEVDSIGNQEVELPDKLVVEVGNDTAAGVQDGDTSRKLLQEQSEDDVSSCSGVLETRKNVSTDLNGSNGNSFASTVEMEDAGSHGNVEITEEQLTVMKLDEDGHRLESQAEPDGTGDRIPVHEPLHTQPSSSQPPLPRSGSLDQQNVTGGSTSNGLPAKSSNETLLPPTNGSSIPAVQPKEKSVFVRLSNRIRDLEVNMSLFSSYLDQLSSSLKRNKNRTEDTQKSLDKRISALNESLQSLKQEVELSVAGLKGVAADLGQVTAAVQEMAAGLHSIKEQITSQHLFVGLIQMIVVMFQLLAVCLCLTCKQRSLGNELRNLRRNIARIPTQNHVTLPRDHMTKNYTHESQSGCCVSELQPSNHIRSVPESEHLGSSDYFNCKHRRKGLATPSQSSLEGSDWDSEPWQLAGRRRKKKGKSYTS